MPSPVKIQAWDAILANLSQELAQPSRERPSVQVMTETDLRRCIREACIAAGMKTLSTAPVLKLLTESGLASRITLEGMDGKPAAVTLWRIGFGAMPELHPLELLQAARPKGVVCYFSALAHHGLTSQMPSHHHIAVLDKRERPEAPVVVSRQGEKVPSKGTFLFSHAALPYYETRRLASLVPGAERVCLGDKALIQVTTLEQTLLDTLHRPWNCGGPAVVFEAWERGMKLLDEARLCEYLQGIKLPLLARRAGCMLELCGHRITDAALSGLLEKARKEAAGMLAAPLLPAVPGRRLLPGWQLEVA